MESFRFFQAAWDESVREVFSKQLSEMCTHTRTRTHVLVYEVVCGVCPATDHPEPEYELRVV